MLKGLHTWITHNIKTTTEVQEVQEGGSSSIHKDLTWELEGGWLSPIWTKNYRVWTGSMASAVKLPFSKALDTEQHLSLCHLSHKLHVRVCIQAYACV